MDTNNYISHLEIQNISYNILIKFRNCCDRYNLRYCLGGGTLLGAVRHKDFIDWDDDIDVLMPRPDYEIFIKLSNNEIGENLKLYHKACMKDPFFAYAKLSDNRTTSIDNSICIKNDLGISIDIFPIDGLPNNYLKIKLHFLFLKVYKYLLNLKIAKYNNSKSITKNIIKNILITIIRKLFRLNWIIDKIDYIAKKYKYDNSIQVAAQTLNYGEKEIMNKEKFTSYIKIKFRNEIFNAPSNYKEYLASLYNNYMQLPLEKNRISTHTEIYMWKNEEAK